ncbi:MAG TPA: bifunctional oligoribonuclease/PAP phosphatase NrnA, partial [Terriglobales bacterium]|nr:bifunctional oligoribonuclease/PAP phosphatase NrnA [Terriglobales bacterium]
MMLERILEEVARRDHFVLTSHARPDGDAIGSVLGCAEILRSMGKHADVVLPHGVPLIYRPLPFADRVLEAS